MKKSLSVKHRIKQVYDEDGEELPDIGKEITQSPSQIISQAHRAALSLRKSMDERGEDAKQLKQGQAKATPKGDHGPGADGRFAAEPVAPATSIELVYAASGLYTAKLPSAMMIKLNKDRTGTGSSPASHSRPSNWSGTTHGYIQTDVLLNDDEDKTAEAEPIRVVPDVSALEPVHGSGAHAGDDPIVRAHVDTCANPHPPQGPPARSTTYEEWCGGQQDPSPQAISSPDNIAPSGRASFRSALSSRCLLDEGQDNNDEEVGQADALESDLHFLAGAEQALSMLRGAIQRNPSKSNLSSSSSLRRMPSTVCKHTSFDIPTQPRAPGAGGSRRGSVDLSQMQPGMPVGSPGRQPGARRGSVDLTYLDDRGQPRASKSVDLSLVERSRSFSLPPINPAAAAPSNALSRSGSTSLSRSTSNGVRFNATDLQARPPTPISTEEPEFTLTNLGKRPPRRNVSRLSVVAGPADAKLRGATQTHSGFGADDDYPAAPPSAPPSALRSRSFSQMHALHRPGGLTADPPSLHHPSTSLGSAASITNHLAHAASLTNHLGPPSMTSTIASAPSYIPSASTQLMTGETFETSWMSSSLFAGGQQGARYTPDQQARVPTPTSGTSAHPSPGFQAHLSGTNAPRFANTSGNNNILSDLLHSGGYRMPKSVGLVVDDDEEAEGGGYFDSPGARSMGPDPRSKSSSALGLAAVSSGQQHRPESTQPLVGRSKSFSPALPPMAASPLQQRLAKYNRPNLAPTPDALFAGEGK